MPLLRWRERNNVSTGPTWFKRFWIFVCCRLRPPPAQNMRDISIEFVEESARQLEAITTPVVVVSVMVCARQAVRHCVVASSP